MKYALLATMFAAMVFSVYAQGYVAPTKSGKDTCECSSDSLLGLCKTAADSAKVQRYLRSKTIQKSTSHNPMVLYGAGKEKGNK